MRQIGALTKELKDLEALLGVVWYRRPFRYWFGSSGINAQLDIGRKRCFQLMDVHLQQTNREYLKLVKANLELFSSESAHFKVTTNTAGLISSYATHFSGKLLDNGYAYCHSVEGKNPLMPMAQFTFPSQLKGSIDHWGTIRLMAVSFDMALVDTLPKAYDGCIDANGHIELWVTDTETDILTGGHLMIDKLMANILGTHGGKASQFVDNKVKLRSIMKGLELSIGS